VKLARAENSGELVVLSGCSLASEWFASNDVDEDGPSCMVRGREASIEEGIEAARQILSKSKRFVVEGLAGTTVEAQRQGVLLAEKYRGVVIGHASKVAARVHRAAQSTGFVTSTLGEVRQRSDVVILWSADPSTTHPRHFERYSLFPEGRFVPRGRADRTLIWVGSSPNASCKLADYVVTIAPGRDAEAATVLRALLDEIELDRNEVQRQTGVPLETWLELTATVKRARYGAVFHDPRNSPDSAECDASAIMKWVQRLNETTCFVYHPLTEGGNGAGLEQVIGWMTGRAGAIDFGSGRPCILTDVESAEDLLGRRSVDAALFISSNPIDEGTPSHWRWLGFIPMISLSSKPSATSESATVWFRTAPFGKSTRGTVFRSDGVALPIEPVQPSRYTSDEEILRQILDQQEQ
jgi:formylmethanofuran dehydrogenase subunit B